MTAVAVAPDRAELAAAYEKAGYNLSVLGERYGPNRHVMARWLKERGIAQQTPERRVPRVPRSGHGALSNISLGPPKPKPTYGPVTAPDDRCARCKKWFDVDRPRAIVETVCQPCFEADPLVGVEL